MNIDEEQETVKCRGKKTRKQLNVAHLCLLRNKYLRNDKFFRYFYYREL